MAGLYPEGVGDLPECGADARADLAGAEVEEERGNAGDQVLHGHLVGECLFGATPDADLSGQLIVGLLDLPGALLDQLLEVLLVASHLDLGLAALGDVTEHQHRPDDVARIVPDRGAGVVDRDDGLVRAFEDRAVLEGAHASLGEGAQCRVGGRLFGLLVVDGEHVGQRSPGGAGGRPPGQRLRYRVHEFDVAAGIRRDHAIADAVQRRRQPLVALFERVLHVDLVERDLDGGTQPGLLKGLHDVACRLARLGAGEHLRVRVGRQEDAGDVVALADDLRRVDPVHLALDHDVHHDQVGALAARDLDRLGGGQCGADDVTAHRDQALGDVLGNDAFVIDYKYSA